MSLIFWIGLGVGALLSLLGSVTANLLHGRIVEFLEGRKLASQSNRMSKALAFHHLVARMHTGRRDRYTYFIRFVAVAIMAWTTAAVLLGAAITAAVVENRGAFDSQIDLSKPADVALLICLFSASVFVILAFRIIRRMVRIETALNNFDRFNADFTAKWEAQLPSSKPTAPELTQTASTTAPPNPG